MIFCSNRKFKIWGYIVSHSSLLIRSERKYPDQDDYTKDNCYNIDLEFWAVNYMNIPTSIDNIIIKEIPEDHLSMEIDKDLLKYNMKIFELESVGRKYYVIAGGLLIGKNSWINQDRIFDYNLNLNHDEIIFQSN
ncbi:hypothetical protein C1637_07525 [Chryseobacterium lactis]|uniref:Uncharacterized protein n=1 Tax=Chryseobacterium lactis TaxID=1241981 RepID=A0A3G6RLB9_CHRLC|nr:hypothetical protein [Chryseobacterium lactis]AZA84679.1 hypothetical protein EG342_23495 [Chryseobacterium lactis]AZB05068.1 hypothetical protein EG341_14375 [Chryseobacterium lactis]PNW14799.1 hypothetical protein C1637_07525 [Chryseobacterium lactis]